MERGTQDMYINQEIINYVGKYFSKCIVICEIYMTQGCACANACSGRCVLIINHHQRSCTDFLVPMTVSA